MPQSEWVKFVMEVYKRGKSRGMSYTQAMKEASKQWRGTKPVEKPKRVKKVAIAKKVKRRTKIEI